MRLFLLSRQSIPLPSGLVAKSNPSVISLSNGDGLLFIQASNGQVYALSVSLAENPKFGKWSMVGGTKLAFDNGTQKKLYLTVIVILPTQPVYVHVKCILCADPNLEK